MAARGEARFELSIGALDRFTRPFQSFGNQVDRATAGVRTFGRESGIAQRRISAALGFPRLSRAAGEVGRAFGNLGAGFDKFTGRLGAVAKGFGLITLLSGGAGAGLWGLVKGYAEAGDAADKAAQKVGLSTTGWQEWSYAAELSGVKGEELSGAFNKLNASAFKAAKGGKEQAAAFKALGVSLKNSKGQLKDTDTLMMEVAEALSKMDDGAKKAAAANAIFGESGTKLLPLLNNGKAGLINLRDEAVRYGVVIDTKGAKAGQAFMGNLNKLGAMAKGLGVELGGKLLPVVNDVVLGISGWVEANREVISTKLTEFVDKLTAKLPEIGAAVEKFVTELPGYIGQVSDFVDSIGGWETVALGAAAVMAGPLISGILGLIPPIISLGAAIMGTPIGWTMAAIAGIAFAAHHLVKNWDKVVGFFTGKFNKVKEAFSGGWVKGLWTAFKEYNPVSLLSDIVYGIIEHFTGVDLYTVGSQWLAGLGSALAGFGGRLWAWIQGGLAGFTESVAGFFSGRVDRVKAAFSEGWLPGIVSVFEEFNPVSMLADFVGGVITYFTGVDLMSVGKAWLQKLWDGFMAAWGDFAAWVEKSVKDLVPEWIVNLIGSGDSGDAAKPAGSPRVSDDLSPASGGSVGGGPAVTSGLVGWQMHNYPVQRTEKYEEKVTKLDVRFDPRLLVSQSGPAENVSVNSSPSMIGVQGM